MKNLSKRVFIFPLLFAAVFLLIGTAVFSTTDGTAFAERNFDIEYPDKGYFPVGDARLIAANAEYTAVYDAAANTVVVRGQSDFAVTLGQKNDLTGMWLSGGVLLVRYGAEPAIKYAAADLNGDRILKDVALDAPENISYIVSDDGHFYAKSDNALAVYGNELGESGLSPIETIDADPNIRGKYIFAANNGKLYFFAQNYDAKDYFVYDWEKRTIDTKRTVDILPSRVSYSDCGLFVDYGGEIAAVDISDGNTVTMHTGIPCTQNAVFTSYDNKLYVINENGGVDIYRTDAENGRVVYVETLSANGSGGERLENPSDLLFSAGRTVIADTGGKILFVNGSEITSAETHGDAPHSLADSPAGIYAASASAVYLIRGAECVKATVSEQAIKDICYMDALYVLTDNALAAYLGGELRQICSVADGIAVTCAQDGKYLYVLTAAGIYTLDALGNRVIPFRPYDFADATDIAVDYAGNIFVSFGETDKIARFSNNPSELTLENEFPLISDLYSASPQALALSGSRIYFASPACFVGSIEVGAVDKESFTPLPVPDIDASAAMSFARLTADAFMYEQPHRFDASRLLTEGATVLVFDGASSQSGFEYVYSDGAFGYVESSSLQTAAPVTSGEEYEIARDGSSLSAYPMSADCKTADEGLRVTLIDDAAGLDGGKWVRVESDGRIWFTERSNVRKYTETVPEKDRVYGKAVADRAGGLVSVYASPDTESAVIAEVTDGARVEVLEDCGDYYYVSVDGVYGYMQKSRVKLDGLTTVQIIAIALSAAVVLVGAVIFTVTYYTRKKEKQ